jgi:hypothetical protein
VAQYLDDGLMELGRIGNAASRRAECYLLASDESHWLTDQRIRPAAEQRCKRRDSTLPAFGRRRTELAIYLEEVGDLTIASVPKSWTAAVEVDAAHNAQ